MSANGTPLQCSCLENPRDGGAWWAAVHGVTQSRTRLKRLSSSSSVFLTYCCSVTKLCLTLCDPMDCSTLGFPVLHYLPEFAQTHVHWVSDAIQPSHPLLPPSLPLLSIFPSIRVFFNELSLCIRWPKYWIFNISYSNEYSEFIYFRIDWFDLFAVQGTLKSLLQHHNSKVSVLWSSAFFMVQLSHPYMTTGKTIALTRQLLAK